MLADDWLGFEIKKVDTRNLNTITPTRLSNLIRVRTDMMRLDAPGLSSKLPVSKIQFFFSCARATKKVAWMRIINFTCTLRIQIIKLYSCGNCKLLAVY